MEKEIEKQEETIELEQLLERTISNHCYKTFSTDVDMIVMSPRTWNNLINQTVPRNLVDRFKGSNPSKLKYKGVTVYRSNDVGYAEFIIS